jgi:hypothetical protein
MPKIQNVGPGFLETTFKISKCRNVRLRLKYSPFQNFGERPWETYSTFQKIEIHQKSFFKNILKKYPYVGEPDNVANEYGQAGIPECPGLLTPSRHKRCVLMAIRMQM